MGEADLIVIVMVMIINNFRCASIFLAVQTESVDSSIGDLVTHF